MEGTASWLFYNVKRLNCKDDPYLPLPCIKKTIFTILVILDLLGIIGIQLVIWFNDSVRYVHEICSFLITNGKVKQHFLFKYIQRKCTLKEIMYRWINSAMLRKKWLLSKLETELTKPIRYNSADWLIDWLIDWLTDWLTD